jgi:tetratricopeptide (TPR) repeat protein
MLGEAGLESTATGNMGLLEIVRGDARQALEFSVRAVEADRRLKRRRSEGIGVGNVAYEYWMLGDTVKALETHKEALAIADEVNNRRYQGLHRGNMARCEVELGQMEEAEEHFLRAVEIARETGHRTHEGLNLAGLGRLHADLGDTAQAEARIGEALEVLRGLPYPRGEAIALTSLGWTRSVAGDAQASIEAYERSRDLCRQCGDRFSLSCALVGLAQAQHHARQVQAARQSAEEALGLDTQYNSYAAAVRLGLIHGETGEQEPARECLSRGIELCGEQLQRAPTHHSALYHLALAQLAQGQPEQALATCREALGACAAKGLVRVALEDVRLLQHFPDPPSLGDAEALLTEAARPA